VNRPPSPLTMLLSQHTRRREVIAGLAATSWPLVARAQPPARVAHVGFLWDSPGVWPEALEGFRRGLRELGWVEGRNIAIDYRWAEGRFNRLGELAAELVAMKVDVIVAPTSIYAEAAKQATSTIPIIFASHADPIGTGHVASLGRPGGNITGLSLLMPETNAKGLELLREAIPSLARVAVVFDPATPSAAPGLEAVKSAALALSMHVQPVAVRKEDEFDRAFTSIVDEHADAVIVLSTPLFMGAAPRLADLALRGKLPTLFGPRAHAEAGALISYGPDRADLYRRAAGYVDKILKGAKPGELPVQQPTTFELVITLKTAAALGLTIPPTLLARADEVIE
jgi:putative tryptophan/tyrosine transport system substrate-binding protein